jgi:hypothetical protein
VNQGSVSLLQKQPKASERTDAYMALCQMSDTDRETAECQLCIARSQKQCAANSSRASVHSAWELCIMCDCQRCITRPVPWPRLSRHGDYERSAGKRS